MKDLKGRVVAITGAASGIGRALAHVLARRGCTLAVCDVDADALDALGQELRRNGHDITVHPVDVSNAAAVEAYASDVLESHGRCHVLINNAGITSSGSFLEHDLDTWRRIIDTNLMGVGVPSLLAPLFGIQRGTHR